MDLAVTANELLDNPWFVLFASGGVIVVLIIIVLIGKGDIDL